MAGSAVYVSGARELVRAFNRLDVDVKGGIREELRAAASDVADEAKRQADQQGLGPPGSSGRAKGTLRASIKPSVRGVEAFVRATANRKGFRYPAMYEYARGRPFLNPALEAKRGDILNRMEGLLDRLAGGF